MMKNTVFNYDKKEIIGLVNSVDTGMSTAVINDDSTLSQLQVNQLLAVQSPKSGRFIIAMIIKIYRKASNIDDEEETEDGEEGTEDEDLDEAIKKRVVRKGKIIRKLICRKGFKAMSGRCIKMAASERRLRAKMAKRGAKKRRAKKSSMLRHRAKSMRIAKRIA